MPEPQASFTDTPEFAWISVPSSGNCCFHRVRALQGRASRSPEDGATTFPQGDAICRGVGNPRNMVFVVWERTQRGDRVLSTLSSKPQNPFSPHVIFVFSALPPREPRVSGCK